MRRQGLLDGLYHLGLSLLLSHELDAVSHHEWRLLFGLRSLGDELAEPWFVGLHLPLFFVVLWFSHAFDDRVRRWTQALVSAFLLVHGGLHLRLSGAADYDFHGLLSRTLIYGAALSGALWFLVRWWEVRRRPKPDRPVKPAASP